MKLEEGLKITIVKIEEATDNDGYAFLKCKGYNQYEFVHPKKGTMKGYNQFTSIRLRPINELQFEEAKNRLFTQTRKAPRINIVAYESELYTNNINGKILPILEVTRWDFTTKKLFAKKDLLNYGKGE